MWIQVKVCSLVVLNHKICILKQNFKEISRKLNLEKLTLPYLTLLLFSYDTKYYEMCGL